MTRDDPPGGVLSEAQKRELLAIKKEDLSISMISRLFGYTTGAKKSLSKNDIRKPGFEIIPPKFNVRAKLTLNAKEYTNKEKVTTTVGQFLFNKLMVEKWLEHIVPNGYYNEVVDKKKFDALSKLVANAILAGNIHIKPNVVEFLNAEEFWGLGLVSIFAPSFDLNMIMPNEALQNKKKELLANAKDHDLDTLVGIEDQLVAEADKATKGNPGKYMFDSGARGSFSNDYKNMMLSIGAVENPATGGTDFIKSNYIEGISKEDLPAAANVIVNAEYPKAIGTAQGGYMSKQFMAVYQTLQIGDPGTDCGTHQGMSIVITKDNLYEYIDQYIIDGSKLVLIDANLPSKYMNRTVKVRSPMYCRDKKICNKCAGERFYKLGIDSMGLTTTSMSGSIQAANLKARHNLSIKMDKIDLNTLFHDDKK